jgi:predicted phosphodiesterase
VRVLLISDLHGNLPATEAVLDAAGSKGWDRALVLGDLVGYGADPAGVIDAVRGLTRATVIRGNHDKVVAGIDNAADFNVVARHAAEWTAAALDEPHLAYLRGLPRGPLAIDGAGLPIAICHGAPFDEDYYVFGIDDATYAFGASSATLVMFGHTHVQIAFHEPPAGQRGGVTPLDSDTITLHSGGRTLLNPGSVGQPRDGDPRAAYALLDTDAGTVQMHRVPYDIAEAQRRILAAGLHGSLAERLLVGR